MLSFSTCLNFVIIILTSIGIYTLIDPPNNIKINVNRVLEYAKWLTGLEICQNGWKEANLQGFKQFLDFNIFGQPLAVNIIYRSLKAHLNNGNSMKPLVLSFHGPTGTGKNFLARALAEFVSNAKDSKYVHTFVPALHFSDISMIETHKSNLLKWIVGNLTECPYSIFVFDEIERIPSTVMDSISPLMDHIGVVNGVDYGKAIYLLLSNSGSAFILNKTVELYKLGYDRNSIKYRDIEDFVITTIYNEPGGYYQSLLILKAVVNQFVPFFPLERMQLEKCARREIEMNDILLFHKKESEVVKSVMDDISFYPPSLPIFSKTGCKRIKDKIFFYADEFD